MDYDRQQQPSVAITQWRRWRYMMAKARWGLRRTIEARRRTAPIASDYDVGSHAAHGALLLDRGTHSSVRGTLQMTSREL